MHGRPSRLVTAVLALVAAGVVGDAAGAGPGPEGAGDPYARKGAPRFDVIRLSVDDGGLPCVGFLSGVSIDPTWAIGVGVEYERFDEADAVPLFVHLRVTPKGGSIGHLVFVEAGYTLLWIQGTSGTEGSGPFVRGGMGRRVGHLFGSEITASLSYRAQASEAYAERTGAEGSVLHEFALSVGFRLGGGAAREESGVPD
jgi:hypothetical protein